MKNNQITLVFTSIEDMWVDIYTKIKIEKIQTLYVFTSFNFSPIILLWQGKIYDYIFVIICIIYFQILDIWMKGKY
jgi:hypothetical protein